MLILVGYFDYLKGYHPSVECVIAQPSVDLVAKQPHIGRANFIGNSRKEIIY